MARFIPNTEGLNTGNPLSPVRSWEADYARLVGSQNFSRGSSNPPLPTTSQPAPSIEGQPRFNLIPAVGSGPVAQRIAESAQFLQRTAPSNRSYYAADPENSCASFVSAALVRAGAFSEKDFTRSASQLAVKAIQNGAIAILPGGTNINSSTVGQVAAGDIILFNDPGQRIHHSGLSIGNGRFIGISSSAGIVKIWDLLNFRSVYQQMRTYRFTH